MESGGRLVVTKLALHCHRSGPDIAAAIRSANWAGCKQLDGTDMLSVAQQAGIPTRILRVFGVEEMVAADAANAIATYDLAPVTHIQLCCEQRCTDVAWQTAVIDGLAGHGYHGRYLAGGFSTGTCSPSDLQTLAPLFERGDVDLALNEYSGILPDDPAWHQWATWTSERHRALLESGTIRVIVTESGGDNVQPDLAGGGWQTRGWTADQYVGLLTKLDQDDQADGYVICRCVFTLGAPPDWAAFEIAPILPQLAAYVTAQASPTKGPTMQGIDVSSEQPGTDWQQVAASGKVFAAIKATEGAGYVNPFFARDWAAAKAAGFVRIAYDFARWDLIDGATEARAFLAALAGVEFDPGDLVALDMELPPGVMDDGRDLAPWEQEWYGLVDAWLGKPAGQYSYSSFFERHQLSMARVGKRWLWLANGTDQPGPLPLDWADVPVIWQHVTTEPVAGVAGNVDVDETDLGADQLRALGKPAPGQPTGIEAEALAYYEQDGVKLDRSHAVWAVGLYPLYTLWRGMAAAGNPLADLVKPGPAVKPEAGATWGDGRPAGVVALTNRTVGAYLDTSGHWRPYQVETA